MPAGAKQLTIQCQCGHEFSLAPVHEGVVSDPDEVLNVLCPNCGVYVNRGYGASIDEADIEE